MDFRTTMELLANRQLSDSEAKDFAYSQWGAVFTYVRAEEVARIKDLEAENEQLKQTVRTLKDNANTVYRLQGENKALKEALTKI